jgi:2',3'-cyclic-nucleotide 2'-phosphodiesterase (5'-nucleotidase family)
LQGYQLITINDRLPADAEIAERVAYWASAVAPAIAQPVGLTEVSLTRNYNGESNLGDVVADGMRWEADLSDDGALNGSVQIALTNPGGLRADIDIPAGARLPYTITWGATFNVLPFGNTLCLMDLTGAQIQTLLNQAASLYKGMLQTSGATWRWRNDCACRTPTQWGAFDVRINGAPLEPARVYRVVTNNFLADGQDGWVTFAQGANRVNTYVDMQEAVNDFIRRQTQAAGAIRQRVEGRSVYVP